MTFTSSYTYDNDDLLATITYPSNRTVTYTLGTEHRLMSVSQNGTSFANTFHYDDAGRLDSYVTGACVWRRTRRLVTTTTGHEATHEHRRGRESEDNPLTHMTFLIESVGPTN